MNEWMNYWSVSLQIYHCIQFCSVLFGVVVHAGCDKQDSLMRDSLCGKRTSTPSATNYCTVDRQNCRLYSTNHRSGSQILVENHDFCLPHLHSMSPLGGPRRNIAMTFGTDKLEWCGYWEVKQIWRYVYLFRLSPQTWRTDRQTDTAQWHRPCLWLALHSKNNTSGSRTSCDVVCI